MQHDLFYLANNSLIPRHIISTTARKGDKWFRAATEGDIVNIFITENQHVLMRAVIVCKELVTYGDVLANASHNHTAFNQAKLAGGRKASDVLAEELTAAYGNNVDADPYTILHIMPLNE